jgi:serine/threonine-protein kinase
MTRTQSIMGSPLYMSPEQMASAKDVDQRSDIWAVGCVLYELITGRVPFEAETMPQLCTLILHAEPPPLRSIRADVPEQLEQVVMRCLRKDRNQRYPNVAALANDLAYFAPDAGPRSAERITKVLSSSGITSSELSSSNLTSRTAGANTGSQAWGNTQTQRKSRAVWYGLAGVGAAAIVGVVLWKATSAPHVSPPEGSAAAAVAKPPAELPSVTPPPAVEPPPAAVAPATAAPVVSAAPSATEPAPVVAKPKPGARPVVASKPKPGDAKPKPAGGGGDVDPLSERN